MTIIWSRQAQDDLLAIRQFIARDSERYADITIERLVTAPDRLTKWPRSGRVVPEVGDETLRELLIGLYRLVYRIEGESIWDGHGDSHGPGLSSTRRCGLTSA